jgi:lambda family phage tail tape measure protein
MAQNLARLGVVLGIDTAQFTTGLQKAKKSLSEIGDFAVKAGAVATAAFAAMTYKAMQFSDEMSDLSDATGINISKILQLSNATQRAGGNFEGGSKAITKFIQNIDAAASGSDEMQKNFAKAGVSLSDLANLSEAELLNKTSQGIADIGNKAAQTGLKMDLFGKSMRTVDMGIFNQYVQKGSTEFEKYEAAIKIAADLMDEFEQVSNKLTLTFIEKVIPSTSLFFETIAKEGTNAFAAYNALLDGTAYVLRQIAVVTEGVSAGFRTLFVSAQALFGTISEDDAWKQMVNIENALKKTIKTVKEYNQETAKGTSPISLGGGKRNIEQGAEAKKAADAAKKEAEKQAEMLKVAKLISDEYDRQQEYSIQQLKIKNQMLGMTQDERRIQEAINQVTTETSRKIDEITKKREDAAGRGAGPDVIAEYDKQIAKVLELEQVFVARAKGIETASIASQRTFQYGWDVAFNQFAENAYNYAAMAEQVFSALTGNMTEAINTFVDTGKFSFSDFTQSIIKDLIKIQLRMQMMQLFSMALGGIGGMMGGGGPQPLGNMGGAGFAGRASGGTVMQDTPYMVGERGAELFVPQRSGTIIPNHQLSAAMGGGSGTTINGPYIASMNAIDTQSGIQFLAKNKMTIWSMNQSANRSIPAGR